MCVTLRNKIRAAPALAEHKYQSLLSYDTSVFYLSPHYFTEVLTLTYIKSFLLLHDPYFNYFRSLPRYVRCATSRTVSGSIPGGVTGDFFRGTPDRTMCPEVDSASESE